MERRQSDGVVALRHFVLERSLFYRQFHRLQDGSTGFRGVFLFDPRMALVASTGDPVEQTVARHNEFQPNVLGAYPSALRQLAFEQVEARLRIRPEYAPIERDRLLLTVLHRRTQPLIRYEAPDMIQSVDRDCRCGRPFWTIEAVEGPTQDVLVFGRSGCRSWQNCGEAPQARRR